MRLPRSFPDTLGGAVEAAVVVRLPALLKGLSEDAADIATEAAGTFADPPVLPLRGRAERGECNLSAERLPWFPFRFGLADLEPGDAARPELLLAAFELDNIFSLAREAALSAAVGDSSRGVASAPVLEPR